jgi:hypothetical protein
MGSKLLILATRTQKAVNLAGDSSLRDLEGHATNPAIFVQPKPDDLLRIANYVLARLNGPDPVVVNPPNEILMAWYKLFGREIGAFVVAISQRRRELARGDYALPESASATWMKERYLSNLAPPDVANAVCLAVFGEQELELDVPEQCLPNPLRVDGLLKLGLVERVTVGSGRFVRYGLRGPGWGALILAAIEFLPDRSQVTIDAASKNILFACTIASRLSVKRNDYSEYWQELARTLVAQPQRLSEQAFETPLDVLSTFLVKALQQAQNGLVDNLWRALATQPQRLAERAFESLLDPLSAFLTTALQQGQKDLVSDLWGALAAQPQRLAERAFESLLDPLGAFLTTGLQQGQKDLVSDLWRALAAQPQKLAERALETRVPGHSCAAGPEECGRRPVARTRRATAKAC